MKRSNEENGIISWFVRNPVAANLLMVFLMIAGILSAIHLKKEIYPESRTEEILIQVQYPGAAPEDVEEGIIKKVEDALQGLEGVKSVIATAAEGLAQISVEAETDVDMGDFMDDIRSRVTAIDAFPDEADPPDISEVIIKTGVLWLALHGPLEDRNLKELSEEIKDDLVSLPCISQVEVIGTKPLEISLNLSEQALREFHLSFEDVADAIEAQSMDLPAGTIKTEHTNIRLRSLGKAKNGADFESMVINSHADGTSIRVLDVASVTDGFSDDDGFLYYNGEKAVGLRVLRTGNGNTLTIADQIKEYVSVKALPEGVTLDIVADMSVHLKNRLTLMVKNMIIGSVLVFLSLALFLRTKVAFWVMMGLPVSFLGALWLMPLPFIDASINMITLYGFILVLGIVVDDAIVIGESIYDSVDRNGPGLNAIVTGAKAVATPATYGVLTTVTAFVPLITIPGSSGKMWSGIGYVVILSLLFSLIESKLILPAHLRHLDNHPRQRKTSWMARRRNDINQKLEKFLEKIYRPALNTCISYRYATLAAFTGIFLLALVCIKAGVVQWVFFPDVDADIIIAELQMSKEVSANRLHEITKQIEQAALQVNKSFITDGEKKPPLQKRVVFADTTPESENTVIFYVELSPSEIRKASTAAVIQRWRRFTKDIAAVPGVKSMKFETLSGGSETPAIKIDLTGNTPATLATMTEKLKQTLDGYNGVLDIRDTRIERKPEIQLSLKQDAEPLGVKLSDVATQVRYAFYGKKLQTLQRGSQEVDVFVRYPKKQRTHLSTLESMHITTDNGRQVPISVVADITMGNGPAQILRKDSKRVVSVLADVDKSIASPDRITAEIMKTAVPELKALYRGVNVSIAGEAEEELQTLNSMKKWAVLSLLTIFALMAIPLKSYIKPLIIMTSIPFGIVGAMLGHLIMGIPVSILSLCGCIALSGVVVNDALVLVDHINRHLRQGGNLRHAVCTAGARRFRAILLTSLTTFFGLLPMVMEKSTQAQFLIPMAVSLSYGILFSTLITLFLIPVLYVCLEDIKQMCSIRQKRHILKTEISIGAEK